MANNKQHSAYLLASALAGLTAGFHVPNIGKAHSHGGIAAKAQHAVKRTKPKHKKRKRK
jgi:hypothetical protein